MNEWISVLLRTLGVMIFLVFRELLQLHLALMGVEMTRLVTQRESENYPFMHKTDMIKFGVSL